MIDPELYQEAYELSLDQLNQKLGRVRPKGHLPGKVFLGETRQLSRVLDGKIRENMLKLSMETPQDPRN